MSRLALVLLQLAPALAVVGELFRAGGQPLPDGSLREQSLAFTRDDLQLYVGGRQSVTEQLGITLFNVTRNGLVPVVKYTDRDFIPHLPEQLIVSPNGQFLYAGTGYGRDRAFGVWWYARQPNGLLTYGGAEFGTYESLPPFSTDLKWAGRGRHLYLSLTSSYATGGPFSLWLYRCDPATGAVSGSVGFPEADRGTYAMQLSTDEANLYAVDDRYLQVWKRNDEDGALSLVQLEEMAGLGFGRNPSGVAVVGDFIYTFCAGDIIVWRRNPADNGRVTSLTSHVGPSEFRFRYTFATQTTVYAIVDYLGLLAYTRDPQTGFLTLSLRGGLDSYPGFINNFALAHGEHALTVSRTSSNGLDGFTAVLELVERETPCGRGVPFRNAPCPSPPPAPTQPELLCTLTLELKEDEVPSRSCVVPFWFGEQRGFMCQAGPGYRLGLDRITLFFDGRERDTELLVFYWHTPRGRAALSLSNQGPLAPAFRSIDTGRADNVYFMDIRLLLFAASGNLFLCRTSRDFCCMLPATAQGGSCFISGQNHTLSRSAECIPSGWRVTIGHRERSPALQFEGCVPQSNLPTDPPRAFIQVATSDSGNRDDPMNWEAKTTVTCARPTTTTTVE